MLYNTGTGELTFSTATSASNKTFVIDHPLEESKYLVHACLEGPEAGVYYRGDGVIENGVCVVDLPKYASVIASKFTVHVTPVCAAAKGTRMYVEVSKVDVNGKFIVSGDDGEFNWIAYGSRAEIDVEPCKYDVKVLGSGPYKYIS